MKNINETAVTDTETVNPNVVIFDTPLMRGEQKIEQVTLTKPNAGTLRGCRWPRWRIPTLMR